MADYNLSLTCAEIDASLEEFHGIFRPEWYDAVGDGVTDDLDECPETQEGLTDYSFQRL